MKRLTIALMSFFLCCFCFIGCSKERHSRHAQFQEWLSQDGRLRVLCSTQMIADLVEKVGGEHVKVLTLIAGELDPHSYELVKGDAEKIHCADLIFSNGLGLECGASLRENFARHAKHFALADQIASLFQSRIIYEGDFPDPHVWTDVSLWAEGVPIIAEDLAQFMPQHEKFFRENATQYYQELQKVHEKIYTHFHAIESKKRYLVASHDAFNYFTKAYLATDEERQTGEWRDRFWAPEGLAPDSQISVSDLKNIGEFLCEKKVHVVFPESNVNPESLKRLAEITKMRGHLIHLSSKQLFADSMGTGKNAARNYVEMMQSNCDTIIEQLCQNPTQ